MFLPFFRALRDEGLPLSPREYLDFLRGLSFGLTLNDPLAFYHFARTAMVKDERFLDRFDRAFARAFKGVEGLSDDDVLKAFDLPADWLAKLAEKTMSPKEMAEIQALGGFDALMKALRDRLAEQKGRHQGGSKWIGTAGTSPFGAYGYNPEGIRIGQDQSRHQRAVKVWDKREFRDLDDKAELGPRGIKLALRRLRRWAREGAEEELDLDATIAATARDGLLNVQTRPERQNAVKVLLFLDVGGSMDPYVTVMEDLFSAARSEFRHLEHWYFHNCLYESVWRSNARRHDQARPTEDLLRSHGSGWKAIFVGDAAMSPYEITHPGGAVEHWNREPGQAWLQRALTQWPNHLWINPIPEEGWRYSPSTALIRRLFSDRMVPMTLDGLARGMKILR